MSNRQQWHQQWLILAQCPGIGARRISALLEQTGDIAKVFSEPDATLKTLGIKPDAIKKLRHPDQEYLSNSLRWLEGNGHSLLTLGDSRYPELLKTIVDPPPVLFVRGNPNALSLPQLAIVGSRNPTPSGRETARAFARHLAATGLAITSGLAIGIDGAGHQGALDADGVTIAVFGCGIDTVYPTSQTTLAEAILERGALVSEFAPGTPPTRHNFPQRNRIVSGLSLGTLVVEAARTSGSLITARFALEQGREVFAVPGSIHSPQSRGCHRLIRQGAKLVESAADIFEELGPMAGALANMAADTPPQESGTKQAAEPDETYQKLLSAMSGAPLTIDAIAQRAGLTAREVSSMLLILELQGFVETVPGGRYSRIMARR